ncbi:Protein FAM113A, partial [Stegodyphus mimosarum]
MWSFWEIQMENSVFGDRLVFHGKKYNGRDYREEREAVCSNAKYSFFFLTRVYDEYVEKVLGKVTENSSPDVIVVNSCLWDLTRWGPKGVEQFKINLKTLMKKFQSLVPDSLVIWLTTPPISSEMKGGFL